MTRARTALVGVAAATVALGMVSAAPAAAKGHRDEVRVSGDCSARADWTLKAKRRDGGLEMEFEVDSNRVGQRWSFRLVHGGVVVASGFRRTLAPSGSFSVERRSGLASRIVTARARNTGNGEVCLATLRV